MQKEIIVPALILEKTGLNKSSSFSPFPRGEKNSSEGKTSLSLNPFEEGKKKKIKETESKRKANARKKLFLTNI
jgi:hypothetical protein